MARYLFLKSFFVATMSITLMFCGGMNAAPAIYFEVEKRSALKKGKGARGERTAHYSNMISDRQSWIYCSQECLA
jgi:hypothetical protein